MFYNSNRPFCAPTCYRPPRWPDPEFPQKIPKKYPRAAKSGTLKNTPKRPKLYPKRAFLVFNGYFFDILGVFWWYFLGVQSFGPEAIFLALFVEIPGQVGQSQKVRLSRLDECHRAASCWIRLQTIYRNVSWTCVREC